MKPELLVLHAVDIKPNIKLVPEVQVAHGKYYVIGPNEKWTLGHTVEQLEKQVESLELRNFELNRKMDQISDILWPDRGDEDEDE